MPCRNHARLASRLAVSISLPFLAASIALAAPAPESVRRDLQLPVAFEANQGQVDEAVRFLVRRPGYMLHLTPGESVFVLEPSAPSRDGEENHRHTRQPPAVVRMQFAGAHADVTVRGGERQPGRVNYLLGSDPETWRTNIPLYGRVHYDDLYPGVDLVYYGNGGQVEYDFVVTAGADPGRIELALDGVTELDVNDEGDLVMQTAGGPLLQRRPAIYQEIDGRNVSVSGEYELRADNRVGFEIADYDRAHPLVIDPVVTYSGYLGGIHNDGARDIAVDSTGNAYIVGSTGSEDFPVTATALQPSYGAGAGDSFVAQLDAAGGSLLYSSFLGGSGEDRGYGIAVDGAGRAYLFGNTSSQDFPATTGALRETHSGDYWDAYVAKLDPVGSTLIYATYLGGSGADNPYGGGIAVDPVGNAHVVGWTDSPNFPVTADAFQPLLRGSTDAFVGKFDPSGRLQYASYLGGSGYEEGNGIALGPNGEFYVTGTTRSSDFPVTPAAFQLLNGGNDDVFISKFADFGSPGL